MAATAPTWGTHSCVRCAHLCVHVLASPGVGILYARCARHSPITVTWPADCTSSSVLFPVLFAIAAVQSVSIHGTKWNVPLETQVGQPVNMKTIDDDVRKLWGTGRFDDVRVETNGSSVVFNVVENPRIFLHEIRLEPHTFGLQVKIPEGTPLNKLRV